MNLSILNDQPVVTIFILGIISLLPFLVMLSTSFVKLTAVLSILRSALGTPQIPPNSVITGLSLVLTVFIMLPVITDIDNNRKVAGMELDEILKGEFSDVKNRLDKIVLPPIKTFLKTHADQEEKQMLEDLLSVQNPDLEHEDSFIVIMVAFVLSELKDAFQIGFLVFLPFLIVDLVIANILQAMGMVMLSPTTISLPFKLMLFVLADGWSMLIQGLVATYI